ncbi:PAAR domain-containing protein [Pseudoalteromonas viridis]|uniref:PAAR domain-containing protein n=1 Tax=Pseudoalteromonas viridis TaxID=339617 RepID=A0ABX7V5X6_9GAMM|nr:PAAR domain-containing protein [Pseudoalteromonas viridis]QTL34113.1 PAAR domain-containing protein [Pseudoalteromonas viridis]
MADVSILGDKADGKPHNKLFDPGVVFIEKPKSRKFTVNGKPVTLVGDKITEHLSKDKKVPHKDVVVATGSALFTLGGVAIARVGDSTSCDALLIGGDAKLDIKT